MIQRDPITPMCCPANLSGRYTGNKRKIRHIAGDDGARGNESVPPDRVSTNDDALRSQRRTLANQCSIVGI